MKAFVYKGPGKKALEGPADLMSRHRRATARSSRRRSAVLTFTPQGRRPDCTPGRILGHESVGIVENRPRVTAFQLGRSRPHLISACKCEFAGGACGPTHHWWLDPGNTIDGTQAEYVRIPQDTALSDPTGADEEALVMLSDILPTGFAAVLNGRVEPGATVAIVGAGPIGLAALHRAVLFARRDHHD